MDLIEIYLKAFKDYLHWLWNDQILISTNSLFGNYFWGIALISITFFIIQVVIPWRKNQAVFRKQFWQDVFYMYFNLFLFYIIFFAGLSAVAESILRSTINTLNINDFEMFNMGDLPIWTQLLIVFIVSDFTHWNIHRMLHKYSFLWRFHSVHHLDTQLDVTTSLRFHFGELLLSSLFKTILILFLGTPISVFIFYEILLSACNQFHHSNIKLSDNLDQILSKFIVTPKYHTNHHTVMKDSRNANYSSILTIWDSIFFTYKDAKIEDRQYLGLDDRSKEFGLIQYIRHPFVKDR